MLNIGLSEMLLIAILVIVFVGPDDLPRLMRALGRNYAKLRQASDELRRAFTLEVDRVEAEKRAEEIRRRREELLARRKAQQARPPDGGPQGRLERSVGGSKAASADAGTAEEADSAAQAPAGGSADASSSEAAPPETTPSSQAGGESTSGADAVDTTPSQPDPAPTTPAKAPSLRRQGEPEDADGIFPTGDAKPGEPRL